MGTIIVLIIVAAIAAFIVRYMIKSGKNPDCGSCCSHCALSDKCHTQNAKK